MTQSPSTPSTHKDAVTHIKRAQPFRLRPALRIAMMQIATKGTTQREAAEVSGMNEKSLCRALARPQVKDALDAMKLEFIEKMKRVKATYKAMALEHAAHLMTNAKSEAVQARMVEFLAGEPSTGSQVNVIVHPDRGGYEFVKPGQRIVDITPTSDSLSGDDDAQVIDDAGD